MAKRKSASGKQGSGSAIRGTDSRPQSASRRKFLVFASLVGAFTGTSALLLALAPASLTPDAARSLAAVDAPQSMEAVFDTPIPLKAARWKSVYIHHSHTREGSATTLAGLGRGLQDHFVICNGNGGADGEVQILQRWTQQSPPGLTPGLGQIDPDCISICLIGDFNQAAPSAAQQQRLMDLLLALQHRLQIPGANVTALEQTREVAGIGARFPMDLLKTRLLP